MPEPGALRIAISDAVLTRPEVDPDRASFSMALHAARDQLIAAQGVLTETPHAVVDLAGRLGRQVLHDLLPARAHGPTRERSNERSPSTPRTPPAAASAPSRKTTITIAVLSAPP